MAIIRLMLARSSDMGKTWTMYKSEEFTGFAHKIKEDNVSKNLLVRRNRNGTCSQSVDAGVNWFRMKNKIPDLHWLGISKFNRKPMTWSWQRMDEG